MAHTPRRTPKREDSLSRDRIIAAAIDLLDSSGPDGLTFRALSQRLATGPGAVYWHVADKSDLLAAACDTILAQTMQAVASGRKPRKTIRALALGMFHAIDAHPWLGAALAAPAGQRPMVRLLEPLGQQVRALGVPLETQWAVVSALLSYIIGVGGRNAANGQLARAEGLDRSDFLKEVADLWSQLDPLQFPFTRSLAPYVRTHDDEADFMAGIDLILRGITASDPH